MPGGMQVRTAVTTVYMYIACGMRASVRSMSGHVSGLFVDGTTPKMSSIQRGPSKPPFGDCAIDSETIVHKYVLRADLGRVDHSCRGAETSQIGQKKTTTRIHRTKSHTHNFASFIWTCPQTRLKGSDQ